MHSYAHMCRDEHIETGHNDSEHEMCPLCRALAENEQVRGERDSHWEVIKDAAAQIERLRAIERAAKLVIAEWQKPGRSVNPPLTDELVRLRETLDEQKEA